MPPGTIVYMRFASTDFMQALVATARSTGTKQNVHRFRGWILVASLLVPAASPHARDAVAADGPQQPEPGAQVSRTGEGGTDGVPSEVEKRELDAEEDPLAADQVKREIKRAEEKKDPDVKPAPDRATGFDLYGSLRLRYRDQGEESEWQDSGSRLGAELDWQFREGSFLLARYEFGFNLITGLQDLNPGKDNSEEFENSLFTRLAYVGLDMPGFAAIGGKNWSAYYKVASFTDRFMGTGASASGAFNAQTDGGPTGPGRADNVLQTRIATGFLPHTVFKPFKLYVQVQHGNPVPFGQGAEYGTAVGVSAVMSTHNNLTVGVAYNHANIDLDTNPSLRDIGISGDARAALVGTRAYGDRWYAGLVFSWLDNHETTSAGTYFKGWGSELYGQYRVADRLWLVGGYNVLEPGADQVQAGNYRVRYAVAGVRFTFDEFKRMLFANVRLEDSVDEAGLRASNDRDRVTAPWQGALWTAIRGGGVFGYR